MGFTSRKAMSFLNLLHAPEMRKNLVFGKLLNKVGFKHIIEFDQFIITKKVYLLARAMLVRIYLI